MLPTTLQAVRSILTADPSLNVPERKRLLTLIRRGPAPQEAAPEPPPPTVRLVRRAEAARRLAVSTRSLDAWARAGVLKKIIIPGHVRGAGFRERDIVGLIEGRGGAQ